MPRPFARTGAIGNFFFIAQWFPKLGVLEEQGWNCHQFHSSTEFFSDYGVYDVRLTVPRGWIVGATGVRARRFGQRGRHHDPPVLPGRRSRLRMDDESGVRGANRSLRTSDPPGRSTLRLLLQPEHRGQADRHIDAARTALKHYGEWFGPYPYGHLTIVDPAYQSDADGMEYPTLITAGTKWLLPREVTYSGPEEVVIHEAGHQWWYGIVGNNEFEDAWLDEGINTFADRARDGAGLSADLCTNVTSSAISCRGCFGMSGFGGKRSGTGSRDTGRAAKSDVLADAGLSFQSRVGTLPSRTTRPRCG